MHTKTGQQVWLGIEGPGGKPDEGGRHTHGDQQAWEYGAKQTRTQAPGLRPQAKTQKAGISDRSEASCAREKPGTQSRISRGRVVVCMEHETKCSPNPLSALPGPMTRGISQPPWWLEAHL